MKFSDINPYVRFARYEEFSQDFFQTAYDRRMFYCAGGSMTMQIGESKYSIEKGEIIYWGPGVDYKVVLRSEDLKLLGFNFDFTSRSAVKSVIPPSKSALFEKDKITENALTDDAPIFNRPFVVRANFDAFDKFDSIVHEYQNMRIYYEEKCSVILRDIIIDIARGASIKKEEKSYAITKDVLAYIRENYDKKLSNEKIAAHFNYHPNYINRLVLKYSGMSMHQYLMKYRVGRAVLLLQSGEVSVGEAAEKVGIDDIKNFSHFFKKATGRCPSDYLIKK